MTQAQSPAQQLPVEATGPRVPLGAGLALRDGEGDASVPALPGGRGAGGNGASTTATSGRAPADSTSDYGLSASGGGAAREQPTVPVAAGSPVVGLDRSLAERALVPLLAAGVAALLAPVVVRRRRRGEEW